MHEELPALYYDGCPDNALPTFWMPRTKYEARRSGDRRVDLLSELMNDPSADMFLAGEPDESSLVPVFNRRSFVDDICFGAETFDACLTMVDRLLSLFEECRISVSFTKSIFVQSRVDFLSHQVSLKASKLILRSFVLSQSSRSLDSKRNAGFPGGTELLQPVHRRLRSLCRGALPANGRWPC
ncbi:unnamed protein product [Phytophthora lilii]|uniref:Unnamed protein product n=1 Tax=Phytophthora lilii TaxID=2077276 RepID=A0A9W6TQ94_9STRA|nr:unnamed protein product [Phytophthora lilii]